MSIYGDWKNAVITILSDDDLTPEVNLGRDYDFMEIQIPALTSCTISIQASEKTGGTFQSLGNVTTSTTTGAYNDVFQIGGWQFIKIATSAGQAANRTFRVRGMRY